MKWWGTEFKWRAGHDCPPAVDSHVKGYKYCRKLWQTATLGYLTRSKLCAIYYPKI